MGILLYGFFLPLVRVILPIMFHRLAWTVPQTLTCAPVSVITESRQLLTSSWALKSFLFWTPDDTFRLTNRKYKSLLALPHDPLVVHPRTSKVPCQFITLRVSCSAYLFVLHNGASNLVPTFIAIYCSFSHSLTWTIFLIRAYKVNMQKFHFGLCVD